MPTATAPTTIDLAPGLVVPLDLATQPIGIFGMRGSGKSNAAVVIAEQLWLAGVPFVALDPVDHWWGLKARADGTPGFAVYVFGGKHGDLPLEPTAGALMAEVVCESSRPIVLCTEQFLEGERARFVTEFALTLRRAPRRGARRTRGSGRREGVRASATLFLGSW